MLTAEDVDATLVKLHDQGIEMFDDALRRHAYKECIYCNSIVKMTHAKVKHNTVIIHQGEADDGAR